MAVLNLWSAPTEHIVDGALDANAADRFKSKAVSLRLPPRPKKPATPKRFELTAKQPQHLTPQHYEYSTGNQHEGSDCKDIIALGVLEVTGQALVVNE